MAVARIVLIVGWIAITHLLPVLEFQTVAA